MKKNRQAISLFTIISAICIYTHITWAETAISKELTKAVVGRTFVSTTLLGGRAVPSGLQGDYQVNSIISPESSHVLFRVETGIIRVDVQPAEMTKRFEPGTTFHASRIDIKDDRVEVKLDTESGASAKLKILLGKGWQSSGTASAVVAQMSRVLRTNAQEASRVDATANADSRPGSADLSPDSYKRNEPGMRPERTVEIGSKTGLGARRVTFVKETYANDLKRGCIATTGGDQQTVYYVGCPYLSQEKTSKTFSPSNAQGAKGLLNLGFKTVLFGNTDHTWAVSILPTGFSPFMPISSDEVLNTYHIETMQLVAEKDKVEISKVTALDRQSWAAKKRAYECLYKAVGDNSTRLLISCSNGGLYMIRSLTEKERNPDALAIFKMGFTIVEETDGQMFDETYIATINGLESPNGRNIPVVNSPEGRKTFIDLIYASDRAKGCRVEATGMNNSLLYVACANMTDETANHIASPEASDFVSSLYQRGFTIAAYGTFSRVSIFQLADAKATPAGVLSSQELLARYNVKSPETIALEQEAAARPRMNPYTELKLGMNKAEIRKILLNRAENRVGPGSPEPGAEPLNCEADQRIPAVVSCISDVYRGNPNVTLHLNFYNDRLFYVGGQCDVAEKACADMERVLTSIAKESPRSEQISGGRTRLLWHSGEVAMSLIKAHYTGWRQIELLDWRIAPAGTPRQ